MLLMLEALPARSGVTVGGDKAYDRGRFVDECRHMGITPHVAQNEPERDRRAHHAASRLRHQSACPNGSKRGLGG